MPTLATKEQLAALLGRELTTAEEGTADLLLELATDVVRVEAAQTLTLVEDDVAVLVGGWASELELPERPVVEVAGITVDGAALDAAGWTFDERRILRRYAVSINVGDGPPGAGSPSGYHWGGPDRSIVVTYTHGYAEDAIPTDLKGITLQAAKRALLNPTDAKQESLGAHSSTFMANEAGVFLTDAERRIARRYRRRTFQ
jgi:hypothetical protein